MFNNLKIGTKLQLCVAVILLASSIVAVFWLENKFKSQMERDIIAQATEMAVMSQNSLNILMLTGMISDPNNRKLFFEKTNASKQITDFRVIRAKNVIDTYGPGLPSEAPKDELDKQVLSSGETITKIETINGKDTLRIVYPYKATKNFRGTDCTSCHFGKENAVLGAASITFDISAQTKEISENILFLWIMASVLFVSMMVLVYFASEKFITRPLKNFQNGLNGFFKFLNRETTQVIQIDSTNNDEIGLMAKAVNENIQKTENTLQEDDKLINEAKNVVRRVKHGWYSENIQSSTSNPILNAFKDDVNGMIRATKQHFQDMNTILEEYAHLNYTSELKINGIEKGGVFELMLTDINKLRDAITEMLVENKSIGLTLQDSSDKLLKNVDTLNKNSTSAAAALEETAAALEEVTSNAKQNSQNVVQMASFADAVIKSAKKGQELSTKTDTAMDEINEKVTAINEAITVIDQIAFQTNILSLNAAVEAATAGEAGKGFAVVAQEVRNLASRSAEAANEIKNLVELAKNKADDGKAVAYDMTQGYEKLYENINNTIELINNVENASKEQQNAISQINDTINSLDKQTQQNANIASVTNTIAKETDNIAEQAMQNVNEKQFIGKDSVQAKVVTTQTQIVNKPSFQNPEQKPQTSKVGQPQKTLNKIESSKQEDDEWVSF